MRNKTGLSLFEWVVDISTILALVLQCADRILPNWMTRFVPYIAILVLILFAISVVSTICNRRKAIVCRSKLMSKTKSYMSNSHNTIVLFGGDLSWADDYADTIKQVTGNAQIVEVIYPEEKFYSARADVLEQFNKRVEKLKWAGAKVYSTKHDYHFRGTLVNVGESDMQIILSKRVYQNFSTPSKNKYHFCLLSSDIPEEHALCNAFLLSYRSIRSECNEI